MQVNQTRFVLTKAAVMANLCVCPIHQLRCDKALVMQNRTNLQSLVRGKNCMKVKIDNMINEASPKTIFFEK